MLNQDARLTREELLSAMDVNWGRFLATINVLTPEEQQMYARTNGHGDLRGLLLHLNTHFQHALETVPGLANDPTLGDDGWTVDTTHAQTKLRANQTLDQIEQDFDDLQTAVAGMIADLPNEALDDNRIYNLLHGVVIDHFLSHQPPGEPQTPSSQHGQIRPEPGIHITEDKPSSEDAYTSRDPRSLT